MYETDLSGNVDQRLVRLFREVFDDPALDVRPELSMKDLPGWDSMQMVNLLLALERDFGVRFRSGMVRRLATVGDITRLIEAHDAAAASRSGALP